MRFWRNKKTNCEDLRISSKHFETQPNYADVEIETILRDLGNWEHLCGPTSSYSEFDCTRCDYKEIFSPLWDGAQFKWEEMNDIIWEHYIKCHQDIVNRMFDRLQITRDSIPAAGIVFKHRLD